MKKEGGSGLVHTHDGRATLVFSWFLVVVVEGVEDVQCDLGRCAMTVTNLSRSMYQSSGYPYLRTEAAVSSPSATLYY